MFTTPIPEALWAGAPLRGARSRDGGPGPSPRRAPDGSDDHDAFIETALPGAFIVELEEHRDERGFFARTFCARRVRAARAEPRISQANMSFNHRRGTLRGLHYQAEPAAEAKLVRCIAGAIFDVIVDLRPGLADVSASS